MKFIKRAAMALLVAAVASVGVGAALAWNQGYRLYAVQTGSMSPTYPTGTLVIDAPATHRAPVAGSVVTFRIGEGLVTHRVLSATGSELTTKGDANPAPDAWTLPLRRVVGHVIAAIPNGGYVLIFFKQPTGVPTLVTGLLSLSLLWSLFFPDSNQPMEKHQTLVNA